MLRICLVKKADSVRILVVREVKPQPFKENQS